jgi:hypothetical protein
VKNKPKRSKPQRPRRRRSEPRSDGAPEIILREPEDALTVLLREAQFLLIKHPIAALSLFRAFVEEGRAFARTAEGRRWKERLAGSELIRRGRVVWEVGTLNLLSEHAPTVLPSKLLDAVIAAANVVDLEPTLARLFGGVEENTDDGDGAR